MRAKSVSQRSEAGRVGQACVWGVWMVFARHGCLYGRWFSSRQGIHVLYVWWYWVAVGSLVWWVCGDGVAVDGPDFTEDGSLEA